MIYDLAIIGGGINGCGIAAEAATRGLSVILCEQNDLGCSTSSASSKLIHGGLRYLEHYDFGLVRGSLRERSILHKIAPHLVRPMRFILPYHPDQRPAWMIRLGLWLYDLLAYHPNSPWPRSRAIPLEPPFQKGFAYYDCVVDDARLVIANALQAQQAGATLLTQTRCTQAKVIHGLWQLDVQANNSPDSFTVQAKACVNATGPFAQQVTEEVCQVPSDYALRLVKGSHIVVPRLAIHQEACAYLLQNTDGRIVFVIPYLEKFTLIGTTDVAFQGDLQHVQIAPEEIAYLLALVNRYWNLELTQDKIVTTWSGVRPLVNDKRSSLSAINRDYKLELITHAGAPFLNILGGKLTTYRSLSEKAINLLKPFFPHCTSSLSASALLPGGEIPNGNISLFVKNLRQQHPFLSQTLCERYVAYYGSRTPRLLENISQLSDLGENFGEEFYAHEIKYLIKYEWAKNLNDILWRRTKMGLFLSETQKNKVGDFLKTLLATSGTPEATKS